MPCDNKPAAARGCLGLYLHVPFCLKKCPYCSFYSVAGSGSLYGEYARAVEGQIQHILGAGWTEDRTVETIFVGGGTPSVLAPEVLASLLSLMRHSFSMAGEEIETSIEINPATVDQASLARLRSAGYNRISIGVQALLDSELQGIGRPHSAADAIRTIREARKAGFSNCSIDLMYGLPGQTPATWRQTLQRAMEQEPDHLAVYELTIEEGTPFAQRKIQGDLALPTEEEAVAMMEMTWETTARAGYHHYEISNYARPGRECRHNINYWRNGWYVGLGPGAVSCLHGRRYTAAADITEFCRRISSGEEWWSDTEMLDRDARFRETVVMGLRMTQGVSMDELYLRFGLAATEYYGGVLKRLESNGLLLIEGDRLRLSPRGMALANQVMMELV